MRITGAPETIDGQDHLVLTRTFTAPIADVWAALTESDRLARWYCTWTGDPSRGRVEVTWAFEDDMPTETYVIEVCDEPNRLRVRTEGDDPEQDWVLDAQLSESAGVTTLRFAQVLNDRRLVTDVGPGWEYYLDRLEDSLRSGGVATTTWEGYLELGPGYAAAFGVSDAPGGGTTARSD